MDEKTAVIIAAAIHDLAGAIRALAASYTADDMEPSGQTFETLDDA